MPLTAGLSTNRLSLTRGVQKNCVGLNQIVHDSTQTNCIFKLGWEKKTAPFYSWFGSTRPTSAKKNQWPKLLSSLDLSCVSTVDSHSLISHSLDLWMWCPVAHCPVCFVLLSFLISLHSSFRRARCCFLSPLPLVSLFLIISLYLFLFHNHSW